LIAQGQARWKAYPTPSIGECSIVSATELSQFSDCDADLGSSGGSLLEFTLSEPPRLIGILAWGYSASGQPDAHKDCDVVSRCMSQHVIITDDIRAKISELSDGIE
jgi:hypothetical protein